MKQSLSMINNLKSITDNRFNADDAMRYLAAAKSATGISEQALITRMVLYAIEHNDEYAHARKSIDPSRTPEDNAKKSLTILRKYKGQSEQSLLAAMVIYSYKAGVPYKK